MATPFAFQRFSKNGTTYDIPIYQLADVTDTSLRVRAKGTTGCFRLITPTTATPIRVAKGGVVKGVDLSIDSVGGGTVNLLKYSQDLSQLTATLWNKGSNVTVLNQNNIKMTAQAGTYIAQSITGTIGQTYTLTVWAKANNGVYNQFDIYAGNSTWFGQDYGRTICTPTDTEQPFSFTFTATQELVVVGIDNMSNANVIDLIVKVQLEVGSATTTYVQTTE